VLNLLGIENFRIVDEFHLKAHLMGHYLFWSSVRGFEEKKNPFFGFK